MNFGIASVFFFLFVTLPMLASATAVPRNDGPCTVGPIQCCQNTGSVQSLGLGAIFALLGITLPDVTGFLAVQCSPLTIIGVGGTSCTGQSVCCNDNVMHGLVNVGCNNVNV